MADDIPANATVDAFSGGQRLQVAVKDLRRFATIETYPGTGITLRRSMAGGLIYTTSSSPVTIIAPTTGQFQTGTHISVMQGGSGQVTFAAMSGVTIRTPKTLNLAKQYAVASIIIIGIDEWLLAGYLEAA